MEGRLLSFKDAGSTSIEIIYGEWVNYLEGQGGVAFQDIKRSTLLKRIELFINLVPVV
jgi:hypothetical protein